MRVLFIVTSFWSFGELLIAKKFAENIKKFGDRAMFLIPPTHQENLKMSALEYMCLVPKSRKFNQIIFHEAQQMFKPDLVILSDFLNYHFTDQHYGLIQQDLEVFSCPIATFDNFDWTVTRKCMDTYGFVSNIPNKVNIQDYGSRIIPCPIANIFLDIKNNKYRYSMKPDAFTLLHQGNNQLRKNHKIEMNTSKKIILVSNAKWQETHLKHPDIFKFIALCNRIFNELLIYLSQKYLVIMVGETDNKFMNQPNIKCLPSLEATVFDEYITMADLYIGRNITSTSMIQIALSGIPCVCLINSYLTFTGFHRSKYGFDFSKEIKHTRLYQYMMYPVGWYKFLNPIIENNPYSSLLYFCEQFDIDRTIETIELLLYSKNEKALRMTKLLNLNTMLDALPKPHEVIRRIITEG